MTTLIRSTNPGHYDRRCDARCHFAAFSGCDCICSGRFHGAGINGTLGERIREAGEELAARLEEAGCDVEAFRAGVRGELEQELEDERQRWLALRRSRNRLRRRFYAARRARSIAAAAAHQGAFDFGASERDSGSQAAAELEQGPEELQTGVSGTPEKRPLNAQAGAQQRRGATSAR